ncbi:MAG: motility associated factor glycosyltransferase family protein, partial [Lachnospiraceae bacterium]|nr:motility associated factor glycosyltransferase family protein [Candidatus Merdinaster equi]
LQTYLPEELPVIIVSSGPSLTESIEDIRAAKGHALIVSADSAVSVLLKHDIIPDLYMCVDPKKHAKHFEDDRVKDIPVICTIQASPASIQGNRAQVFCTDVDDVYIKAFCTLHGINLTDICSGGSVANDIFSAMMAVGLRRIILVGQDLAYTGHKSHAEGSLRASWDLDLSFNAAEVEGLNGQMVASSQEFIQYRNWFERMISQYPQMNVINATAQGARIHGAVEMPMSEALSTYCNKEYDIAGIFACARPIMGTELKKEFRTYIGSSIKGFDEVDERLRSGINAYGEMLKMVLARNYQNARFQKLYEGVTTTNEILETEPCMGYAENLVQAQITEFMKDAYEQQSDEREEIRVALERGLEYFKLIRGAGTEAKDLIQSINDAVSPLYDEKIDNSSQFAMKLALDKCSGTETDYDAAQRLWEDTLRVIDPGADFTTLSAYLDLYSPGMNSIIRDHVVEGFVEDMNTRKKHLREDATSQRLVLDGIIEEISDRKDGCLRSIIEKMTGQK